MESKKPDWHRLAMQVQQRRRELGLTQEAVRARGGPSTATMRLIEGALQDTYRPGVLADLERALNWAHGSVEAVLSGGEPAEGTYTFGIYTGTELAARAAEDRRGDRAVDAPSDDADIQVVMDSDLPEEEKHRIVRDLLADRVEERRRRVAQARRYIALYQRAQGE